MVGTTPRSVETMLYNLSRRMSLAGSKPLQLVLLGPGESFGVTDATPGTRFLLMAGKPYGEAPVFNGPYVD
jgi:redox-sensitive bicupin YhaK (pirin superfamily)